MTLQSASEVSFVMALLEREEQLRRDAKADQDALRQEMQQRATDEHAQQEAKFEKRMQEMVAKMDAMRDELKGQKEMATGRQIAALQVRLQALYAAELLSEAELHVVEDIIVDALELTTVAGTMTQELMQTSALVVKVVKLVVLSERIDADVAFARQVRRKYVDA